MWFTLFLMKNYTLMQEPKVQGRACCQNTTLTWGLFLVTSELLRSRCCRLKSSFRGDLRGRFHVRPNCAMLSLWVNLLHKRSEGLASGRNASSAEFNSVWRAQVRPLRPKITQTFNLDAKIQMLCQTFPLFIHSFSLICYFLLSSSKTSILFAVLNSK